jgi:protein FrlC
MKLAFSTNAFKRHSLEHAIKEIKAIGYDGVEFLCDVPHAYPPSFGDDKVRSTLDTLSSTGLQISNLNAFTLYAIGDVYHPSWIEADESSRNVRIQHTADCLRLAKKLGAKNISTEPGGPYSASENASSLLKVFASGVRAASKVAEETGVKLLIEPEPSLLLETSSQFKEFIKGIGSDYVKLNFDIGHFFCVREDPARLVHELAEYTEHFHVADIATTRVHNHLIPGLGAVDFAKVFDAMDEIGYRGFATVELYPYQEDPAGAARAAFNHLKGIRQSSKR